ncbi:MAG: hypothetical protein NTW30_05075 [Candidatus Aenigmarchaeota archaeon]|nr:hypothetical protein [Candidatus Aenigmarchaeota archaeon]
MNNEKQIIYLDKKVCKICTHLMGELGTKTKSCTAKKGNAKCPAQWYQIEVGVDTEAAIENFYLAVQSGDPALIVAAIQESQANPKVSGAIIADLQERLFETSENDMLSEGDLEEADFSQFEVPSEEELAEDLEDEDEDEDVEA